MLNFEIIQPQGQKSNSDELVDQQVVVPQEADSDKVKQINGSLMSRLKFQWHIIQDDLSKKSLSFNLGLLSVYIVVSTLTFIFSLLFLSQFLFLRMSEDISSDVDILLTPHQKPQFSSHLSNLSSLQQQLMSHFIDSTFVENKLKTLKDFQGVAPRWYLEAKAFNSDKTDYVNIILILANQTQEINIGLGKGLKHQRALNSSEAFISQSALNLLGYQKFQDTTVVLYIDLLYSLLAQQDVQGLSLKIKEIYINLKQNQALTRKQFVNQLQKKILVLAKNQTDYQEMMSLGGILVKYLSLKQKNPSLLTYIIGTFKQQEKIRNLQASQEQLEQDTKKVLSDVLLQSVNVTKIIEEIIPFFIDQGDLYQNITVIESIQNPKGKWSQGLGSVLIMDLGSFVGTSIDQFVQNLWDNRHYIFDVIVDSVIGNKEQTKETLMKFVYQYQNEIQNDLKQYFTSWRIEKYSMVSNIIVSNKPWLYGYENQLNVKLVDLSNKVMNSLGKNFDVQLQTPIALSYLELAVFTVFFDNLSAIVIFLLSYVSGVVIFSLISFKVDEKSYIYGMFRVLGLPAKDITLQLFIQSLILSFVGSILGLASAFILGVISKYLLYKYSTEQGSYNLNAPSIALGLFTGLIVPFFANILPALKALGTKLINALDTKKRNIVDIEFFAQNQTENGLSITQIIISLYMVVIGFTSFYVVSYFFIFQNFRFLSYFLVLILMLLIIGFIVLINDFSPQANCYTAQLIGLFTLQSSGMMSLVEKNIKNNKKKNFRIGILFNLSIIFLFLSFKGFVIIQNQLKNTIKQAIGSDIVVYSSDPQGLKELQISQFLKNFTQKYPNQIKDFTFVTRELTQLPANPGELRFSTLARYPTLDSNLVGVYKNFLNCVYTETYIETAYYQNLVQTRIKQDGRRDGIADLFEYDKLNKKIDEKNIFKFQTNSQKRQINSTLINLNPKIIPLLLMEGFSSTLGVTINSSILINNRGKPLLSKVVHIAKKVPGFISTSSKLGAFVHTALTTIENLAYILAVYENEWRKKFNITNIRNITQFQSENITYLIPKNRLFIKLQQQNKLTRLQRSVLLNSLKAYIPPDSSRFFDTEEILLSTETAIFILNLFFFSVAIISITLTFFVLLVTLIRNITENSRELGELRAIGLTKTDILKLCIIEQMSILIVAAVLGIIIGVSITSMLINVFSLLNEMNYSIDIPWFFVFSIVLLTFFISWLTARTALKSIINRSISEIFRLD